MVAREVRKHRGVEGSRPEAVECESVRGRLERHMGDPVAAHSREQSLELDRVGRGERSRLLRAAPAVLDRPDDARRVPGSDEYRLEEPGGRRLAAGPRHRDDGHRPAGVPGHGTGCLGHEGARRPAGDERAIRRRLDRVRAIVRERDRRRPPRERFARVTRSIGLLAGQADEEVARDDVARVEDHARDPRARFAGDQARTRGTVREQAREFHAPGFGRAGRRRHGTADGGFRWRVHRLGSSRRTTLSPA